MSTATRLRLSVVLLAAALAAMVIGWHLLAGALAAGAILSTPE